jgi:single-stranded-DNA-specific exonuclease
MWAALARATGQDRDTLRWMLEVFDELGFLNRTDRAVALANDPPKRDLGQSRAYREKMAAQEAERLLIRSGAKELAEYLRGMLPPRARLA